MANYNINKSDGTPFTISTGTINNTFDIPFLGQDAINYGDDLARANLRLLENFANTTAPSFGTTRTRGQLWYDTTAVTGRLNVYDGSSWDAIPLDIDVVHISGAEVIAGIKTFSSAPDFQSAGAGFTVANNTEITNLNANFLNGLTASAFASSAQGDLADTAEQALPINSNAGYVLSETSGSGSPPNTYAWVSLAVSSGQVNVNPASIGPIIDPTTSVMLVDVTSDTLQNPRYAAGLTYNASTGVLTSLFAGTLTGTLVGNASTATSATTATTATNVTVANEAADTTCFPLFVTAATGGRPPKTNASLTFNSSTGVLTGVYAGTGAALTALNMTTGPGAGTLATGRGGTGVTAASTGTGGVVLSTAPTFVTNITTPIVKNGATGPVLQYNSITELTTQAHTASGKTTGAQVKARNGTLYDVGMNVLPTFNIDAADIIEAQHCGTASYITTATPRTLTLEAIASTDFPVGGVTTIINASATADYTITKGADGSIYYIEGGLGASAALTSLTVGPGGAATLWRNAAGVWWIWGSQIGNLTP